MKKETNNWVARLPKDTEFLYLDFVDKVPRDFYTTVKVPVGSNGYPQQRRALNNIKQQMGIELQMHPQSIVLYQSDLKWTLKEDSKDATK